jgi:hypothetical protein
MNATATANIDVYSEPSLAATVAGGIRSFFSWVADGLRWAWDVLVAAKDAVVSAFHEAKAAVVEVVRAADRVIGDACRSFGRMLLHVRDRMVVFFEPVALAFWHQVQDRWPVLADQAERAYAAARCWLDGALRRYSAWQRKFPITVACAEGLVCGVLGNLICHSPGLLWVIVPGYLLAFFVL